MVTEILLASVALLSSLGNNFQPAVNTPSATFVEQRQVLATHEFDLTNRLPDEYGNQVFADNILLTLRYLKKDQESLKVDGEKKIQGNVNWEKVREPFEVSIVLEPGEVFAYHDTILPEFHGLPLKTTNAHFTLSEGYKSLSGLPGNGVCHLATLINWVASESGLEVISKVDHDFYPVPGVPRKNGTSIRWGPNGEYNSRNQNLYVKNNFDFPVIFEFEASETVVIFKILK